MNYVTSQWLVNFAKDQYQKTVQITFCQQKSVKWSSTDGSFSQEGIKAMSLVYIMLCLPVDTEGPGFQFGWGDGSDSNQGASVT